MKRLFNLFGILIIISIISATISLALINVEEEFVIPDGTKFIAHRGLSSQHYENSEQAFLAAAQSDFFFGIETDIWLTADGVWVCAHDENPFVDSTKTIYDITYNQALNLPLDTSNADYGIPEEDIYICSFKKYLDICIEYNKIPVIELKYVPLKADLEQLVDYISQKTQLNKVMFISFQSSNVSNLVDINPDLLVMLLTNKSIMANLLKESGNNAGIKYTLVDQDMITSIQARGAYINVWTINDIEDVLQFINFGVDFITTDFVFYLNLN